MVNWALMVFDLYFLRVTAVVESTVVAHDLLAVLDRPTRFGVGVEADDEEQDPPHCFTGLSRIAR